MVVVINTIGFLLYLLKVVIKNVMDTGAYVDLIEYNGIEGILIIRDNFIYARINLT